MRSKYLSPVNFAVLLPGPRAHLFDDLVRLVGDEDRVAGAVFLHVAVGFFQSHAVHEVSTNVREGVAGTRHELVECRVRSDRQILGALIRKHVLDLVVIKFLYLSDLDV